ncbi:MAG: response regulator transcription factor [Rhodospirillales bacterium]|nr:response regulator transcription factor [Rhodospirillales bacterium]MBO6787816.1 response regulator transcription factor [Rhodospirillales bacterium]
MTLTPSNHTVAIVDDDDLFRESLGGNLETEGFSVVHFGNGHAALEAFAHGTSADLVLLDWKMPEINGIEVLRQLRADGYAVPVIFLTVLSDQIYEEAALLGGAIDFVEKSRSFAILLKRIELALSGSSEATRQTRHAEQRVQVGSLDLNADGKYATWQGREVDLTVGEFDIVEALARRAGDNLSYRDIYDIVRGQGFVAGHGDEGYRQNVRTFIKRVRRKFRDVDASFDAIENYPGYGYRWGGERGET